VEPIDILQRYWGYESFRANQEAIIKCILQGRDAAVVLPGPTLSVLRPQHRRSAELGATREADVPNTDPSWTLCDSCK